MLGNEDVRILNEAQGKVRVYERKLRVVCDVSAYVAHEAIAGTCVKS